MILKNKHFNLTRIKRKVFLVRLVICFHCLTASSFKEVTLLFKDDASRGSVLEIHNKTRKLTYESAVFIRSILFYEINSRVN